MMTGAGKQALPRTLLVVRASDLVWVAALFFAISLFKFVKRDPLASNLGFQGPLEAILIAASFGLAVLAYFEQHRLLRLPRSVVLILLFGLLALASAVSSFFPLLSATKAVIFLLIVLTAVFACSAIEAGRVLSRFYWAVVLVLVGGIAIGVLWPSHYPLLRADINTLSGWRTRLWIFETFGGVIADYVVVVFLIGCLIRPPHYRMAQGLLLLINFLCAGRTSTALLLLCLCILSFYRFTRATRRWLVVCGMISCILLGGILVLMLPSIMTWDVTNTSGGQGLVARTLAEGPSLNGRTGLWKFAIQLLKNRVVLGYGFEGSRPLFLAETPWADTAHNGYLDLLLIGGVIGGTLLMIGWLLIVFRTRRLAVKHDRLCVYLIHMYLGLTSIIGGQIAAVPALGVFIVVVLSYFTIGSSDDHKVPRRTARAPKLNGG